MVDKKTKEDFKFVLKLEESLDDLAPNEIRHFEKERAKRDLAYPTLPNSHILLANKDGAICAEISVLNYSEYSSKIRGEYKVWSVFNSSRRKFLTKLYKELPE